jgi:hypothetical protein
MQTQASRPAVRRAPLLARLLARLLAVGLLSTALPAAAADGEGTRVVVRLAESAGALPEGRKVVQSLTGVNGGEVQVKVLQKKRDGQAELVVELWGNTVPAPDVPAALRQAFPVLAAADIQVSALPADARPQPGDLEGCEQQASAEGRKVKCVVKKVVTGEHAPE